MPINNSIDDNEKIVYSICSGVMTSDDFVLYINRIWSHATYFGYNELFDTRDADWTEFDFGFLFKVAENAAKLNTIDPGSKLAWVVLEGKQKELTDFYKSAKGLMNVKSRSLQAFYSKEEAMQWLQQ